MLACYAAPLARSAADQGAKRARTGQRSHTLRPSGPGFTEEGEPASDMIRRRYFSNQLLDLSEVDRGTLLLDADQGYTALFDFCREIALVLGAKDKDKIVFQCACGALAILSKEHLARLGERVRGARDEALCPQCAGYEISIRKGAPQSVIGQGLAALDRLLAAARDDNYASLCGFLFSPVMPEAAQLSALSDGAAVVRELIAKNKLDLLLSEQGVAAVPVELGFATRADLTLHLLSYHRLYTFSPLYDTLISLVAIGTGDQQILDPEGQALQPVGVQIGQAGTGTPGGAEREAVAIERKIDEVLSYCEAQGQGEIAALITAVCRRELDRAIVEAAYETSEDTLFLTRAGVELPLAELVDISLGLHLLVERICAFLTEEHRRFAASEGVEEGGFQLSPVADGEKVALKITSRPGG